MHIGVSTSCFYPALTEDAAQRLQTAGVQYLELFLNTFSEIEPGYLNALKSQLDATGARVLAFHPFTSSMEPFFFATSYERRFADGVAMYRRLFEAAALVGAKIFNFHGDYKASPYPFELYCEHFARLADIAAEYGILLSQENVVRCKSGSIENIRKMRALLGDKAHFTLDLKQAVRSEVSAEEMLDAMGDSLCHLHISDHTAQQDCLAPGAGQFDFEDFFQKLHWRGYQGSAVIELYRGNFAEMANLLQGLRYLETITAKTF